MTRYKRELSKRGFINNHEFPYLPYNELDSVKVEFYLYKILYINNSY